MSDPTFEEHEIEYYFKNRVEAIRKDMEIKRQVFQGQCIHTLGANSKDCMYCANILKHVNYLVQDWCDEL